MELTQNFNILENSTRPIYCTRVDLRMLLIEDVAAADSEMCHRQLSCSKKSMEIKSFLNIWKTWLYFRNPFEIIWSDQLKMPWLCWCTAQLMQWHLAHMRACEDTWHDENRVKIEDTCEAGKCKGAIVGLVLDLGQLHPCPHQRLTQ